ncbi:MAG: DNA recombination protein RmuC [Bacteroidaceae bacterium]|nr:DNA recombination protein RmuC [Bacteroidaceae bacterium]MDO4993465.1 DNA recombination protein RmuC [Bacteroidales bacterium]
MVEIIVIVVLAVGLIAVAVMLMQARERATKAESEVSSLHQSLDVQKTSNDSIVGNLKESHRQEVDRLKEQFEQSKREQREQADAAKQEMQQQWEEKMRVMKLEFDKLSADHLKQQQEQMKATNKESVENLLNPLRETIDKFSKEFQDKMTDTARTDAVMQEAIKTLNAQTTQLGKDAQNLAQALKADPKKQGDWGEAVLKNILEASGLTEGVDFFTQEHLRDDEGRVDIPDVKVKLHGDSYLIIDSKTSIKAYLDYVNAEDTVAQDRALKDHLLSVRSHVNELADKHYPRKVENAAEYVLMFIPNEGSYILAMENDARLAADAYKRHIIIVNPTNLMLALKIVWLFWQNEKQAKNVKDIIDSAKKMYEKFATFSETFTKMGEQIGTVQRTWQQGLSQISEGKGNFVRQLESLKEKGVITDKRINQKLLPSEEEE